METKKSKQEKLHEIRSENARHEKRDSRGRFTASDKKNKNNKPSNKINGEIDIIVVDDGCGCDCM